MAESEVLDTEEEKHGPATEETSVRVLYTAETPEDESNSVVQPLLRHKAQHSCDENHKAGVPAATDGADQKTSAPQELQSAGRDQPRCSGSVRSLSSDSSRQECPICSELFDTHGEHRVTLLNCDHALCHHCTTGIMRRAKDQTRLQCPFCRQTTPFPQWEIRLLQEQSYSNSVYEPAPALVSSPGPELQAVPASPLCCLALERQLHGHACSCLFVHPSCLVRGLRLMRLHSLCFSITALLLLFLLMLGCFFYMVAPAIMR